MNVSDLAKAWDGLKNEHVGGEGAVVLGKSTVVCKISDVTR